MKNIVKSEISLIRVIDLIWTAFVAPLAGALAIGICARSFITGDVVSGIIWTIFAVPAMFDAYEQVKDLIERR